MTQIEKALREAHACFQQIIGEMNAGLGSSYGETREQVRRCAKAAEAALSTSPVQAITEEMVEERIDWLIDAVACSTQNRMFLRGEPEADDVAIESIMLCAKKAFMYLLRPANTVVLQPLKQDQIDYLGSLKGTSPSPDTLIIEPSCTAPSDAVQREEEDQQGCDVEIDDVPCVAVGYSGTPGDGGHIKPSGMYIFTWLPKGYGPTPEDKTVALLFDGFDPDFQSALGRDKRHPLVEGIAQTIEDYFRANPIPPAKEPK